MPEQGKELFTLYVNAEKEIPLGAVLVRAKLGRTEDGTTPDNGLYFYYSTRSEAEDAKALAEEVPSIDCTIRHDKP